MNHRFTDFFIKNLFLFVLVGWAFTPSSAQTPTADIDENTFGAIEARHIGPAAMSGRVAALDASAKDPLLLYVGAAGGGVWKSKNGGTTFKAVFEDHPQSIGAIAINQQQPDTVWVGTGEPWTRNSVSVGTGIYKTMNGGEKWELMGLPNSERIARIVLHPTNGEVVNVAVLGNLWNSSPDRGVYQTTDGGKTWTKTLYVDENTGAADLCIHPNNPNILYAGMWDFRRQPHTFRSGGKGSGLFRSEDGGKTWKKLSGNGLPETELGRISVAVSPVSPYATYALIESEKTALYRSDDNGQTWKMTNSSPAVGERPFYFSNLTPDPKEADRIYKPGFMLQVSNDRGNTFSGAAVEGGNYHVDLHAFWVSPKNNRNMYLGTDGGVYVSNDKGNTWTFLQNLPLSQFYHVASDNEFPYNVYGGLQDNGSWMAPSRAAGGITNADWKSIGFGDGFNAFPDKQDNNIIYWQWQGGNIVRYYKQTGEFKQIRPFAQSAKDQLRFNWNTPYTFGEKSGHLYVGAQFLFRSKDRGDTWEKISPDLTTNDPEKLKQEQSGGLTVDNSTAENHCTIYTIGESPLDASIIWVGTDDGNIQVTKDGGKTWDNVTGNLAGLPKNTWTSFIEPDRFDKATAYAVFDGHTLGDKNPYLYKTTDYGKTWTNLAAGKVPTFCRVMRQDLVNQNLLFLGTELGLYISIDGGKNWVRFKGNFPQVAVYDMHIHPREHDLVIATHGRGILIIDDLTALRQITTGLVEQEVAFIKHSPYIIRTPGSYQAFSGDQTFVGRNPSTVANITYYLKKRHVFGDMYLEVYNDSGEKITTLPAGKRKGINRVKWATRRKPPKVPASQSLDFQAAFGPSLPTGNYTIKLIKGDKTYETDMSIRFDSNSMHSIADREAQLAATNQAYDMLEDLSFVAKQVTDIMDQANKLKDKAKDANLKNGLTQLAEKMDRHRKELMATTKSSGITGEIRLREKLSEIYSAISSFDGRPTQSQLDRMKSIGYEISDVKGMLEKTQAGEISGINSMLTTEGLAPIALITREQFDKEEEAGGAPMPHNENQARQLQRTLFEMEVKNK
ncbi:MAG: glycosyl hydrolase [Sphingobacteriales bacterium]|nr:MAG: glycosyl hydrolase [Sphingobacteriales bacterium]